MTEERRKRTVSKADYAAERRTRVQDTFKLDPTVIITLRGKELVFEFTNEALIGILTDTGKNLLGEPLTTQDMVQPPILEAIMWWGLHSNQPELTRAEVGRMYTMRHFVGIRDKVVDALSLFMPEMSDLEMEEEKEADTENPIKP